MKKTYVFIILIGAFFLSTNYAHSQGKFYYGFEEKIFINEVSNKFVISFDKQYLSDIQTSLQKNNQIQQIEFQIKNSCCILTIEKSDLKTLKEYFSKQIGIKSINPMYIRTAYHTFIR